jgi:hypothetical protein
MIGVVQLAREVEALWILPVAFYELSNNFHEIGTNIFHGAVYNGMQTQLSMVDQQSALQGQIIQSRSSVGMMRFLYSPSDIAGCESPNQCPAPRREAMALSLGLLEAHPSSAPLAFWGSESAWSWFEGGDGGVVCPTCLNAFKTRCEEDRQAFWDKLPSMYNLPPWAELETMMVAEIGNPFM